MNNKRLKVNYNGLINKKIQITYNNNLQIITKYKVQIQIIIFNNKQ